MCTKIHIVYTMYTTLLYWVEGGGGCLRGLSYYFPRFQHFHFQRGVQVIVGIESCLV